MQLIGRMTLTKNVVGALVVAIALVWGTLAGADAIPVTPWQVEGSGSRTAADAESGCAAASSEAEAAPTAAVNPRSRHSFGPLSE